MGIKLILKARYGLTAKKVTMTHPKTGKKYQQTVWVQSGQQKKKEKDFSDFPKMSAEEKRDIVWFLDEKNYRLHRPKKIKQLVDAGYVKLRPSNPKNYAKLTKKGVAWREKYRTTDEYKN